MRTSKRGWVAGLLIAVCSVGLAIADTRDNDLRLQSVGTEKLARLKLGDRVEVRVDNGVATLSGSVDSIGLKERAAKEISKVNGIAGVTNNLNVSEPGASPEQILGKAVHAVRMYPFYTIFDNVELSMDGGRLKLQGQVAEPWRKRDIEQLVSMIPGVREIENRLEVLPLSPFDNGLRVRIATAIYRNPELSNYAFRADPPIHIIVKNGNVTLTGVVHSEVDKAVATNVARFAATYFALDNQLKVETTMAKAHS